MDLKPWNSLYCCIFWALWAWRYVNYFPWPVVKQALIPEMLQHSINMAPTAEDSQEYTVQHLPTSHFIYSIIGRAQLLREHKWSIWKFPFSPQTQRPLCSHRGVCNTIESASWDDPLEFTGSSSHQSIQTITWEILWMADKLCKSSNYTTKNTFQQT